MALSNVERARLFRKRHPEHAEKQRAYYKKWYAANAESERAKARERYKRNRELRRKQQRDWRKANPDNWRQWRKEHPDRWRELDSRGARRRRERLLNAAPDDVEVANAYEAVLSADPCAYCGGSMEHIDHIDALACDGTGEWDNLAAACAVCNQRKGTKPMLDFMLQKAA